MKVGIIGLGRMGEGMSRRMIAKGIEVHGYRNNYEKANEQYEKGYISGFTTSLESLVQVVHSTTGVFTDTARVPGIFMMVVPAETVEDTLNELLQFCVEGDIIIDHGNSNFKDSRRRAERLVKLGISYIDCGTSGGVYGLERGYCLMVGGANTAVSVCAPIFRALAPGIGATSRTNPLDYETSAEHGWLHCGPPGAGHFVKMVHNGIEYGIMQAYAEGFNILHEANAGAKYVKEGDAEVAPMDCPEDYCYDIDVSEVAELWRRGSVVGSWLLDLTADVLRRDRELGKYDGGVSDSGEGRWTVNAAVDLGVPAPVITSALFARFESRRLGRFTNRVLNGMRAMFGGHDVR
ncbi:6-phosphogluconate dehydrogenase [Synechococcus phage S-RIM2]|uniref:6-phosphogluconate dehydrogenase n=1 Tax=Synechococcus phage S-RIM2 TaxID=687800 RepID=A0A1D7RAP9_9CAUD|nr:6-phosphogluconate dehydrogenase [Synechococcus phage S-RIM2]AON99125.1 6-phosphogluconate dehydrogenase [Synechococcus phage S-RIM2]AON99554.1 6-phosphogluconate dehydrogenase [Synechococcus phage S-RIM2]AON99767.1 6-phosphogluconate dehydrogenase [Synechococcus phage S-RIM2]AON99981.1 6-phosphogluconate dehydrogenase [Synechococcus phage S-RIM2]